MDTHHPHDCSVESHARRRHSVARLCAITAATFLLACSHDSEPSGATDTDGSGGATETTETMPTSGPSSSTDGPSDSGSESETGPADTDDPPEVRVGHFEGPVAGLRYETASLAGETNAEGAFEYGEGETVQFFLGDQPLGEVEGAESVTIFDLAGLDPPVQAREVRAASNHLDNSLGGSPLEVATNLAVLLYTVDADADPTNGVVVSAEIHDAAQGIGLDLSVRPPDFAGDRTYTWRPTRAASFPLRRLVRDGELAGLWGEREIVRPSYALDDLYDALGLQPAIFVEVSCDESAGDGYDSTWSHEFDERANRVASHFEFWTGENEDWTHTYGPTGNLTSSVGMSNNGLPASTASFTYDGWGNKIGFEDEDSSIEAVYDDVGNRLSASEVVYGNGYSDRYTYDDEGFDIVYTYEEDGTVYLTVTRSYEDGLLVRVEAVEDGFVQRTERTYDDSGHLWRIQEYENDALTSTQTYEYDRAGRQILWELFDGEGTLSGRRTVEYDEFGNETALEVDNDGDGEVDYNGSCATDEIGNHETCTFADPTSTTTQTYVYDPDGNLLSLSVEVIDDAPQDSWSSITTCESERIDSWGASGSLRLRGE